MNSNVGNAQVYMANDQRTSKEGDNQPERFQEGKPNSHMANDPKDERSIANRLANASKQDKEGDTETEETRMVKEDATLPAKSHGNKPSRGAEIDREIQKEEEEILKKKGTFGPKN